MLAHELRNPLAPIRTGLELIRRGGDTVAAVARVRAMMERQVGHMIRLIDDLLDVARITSGKIALQRESTSLGSLILLDIGMRGRDGYETCQPIRRVLGNRVMLVALTGFGQKQDRREPREQDSTRISRSLPTGRP
jgi:signal transduction histidine kinase